MHHEFISIRGEWCVHGGLSSYFVYNYVLNSPSVYKILHQFRKSCKEKIYTHEFKNYMFGLPIVVNEIATILISQASKNYSHNEIYMFVCTTQLLKRVDSQFDIYFNDRSETISCKKIILDDILS